MHLVVGKNQIERYYREEGRADAMVIELPKGGYTPLIKRRDEPAAPRRSRQAFSLSGSANRPLLRRQGEADLDYSDASLLEEMLRAKRDFETPSYRVLCSEHKYRRIAEGRTARDYRRCYGQHFAMVAAADQRMYVCCHMRGVDKYAVGDLRRQSIAEVCDSAERLAAGGRHHRESTAAVRARVRRTCAIRPWPGKPLPRHCGDRLVDRAATQRGRDHAGRGCGALRG